MHDKRMVKRKSLTRKFVLGFIVISVILGLSNASLSYQGYKNDIAEQYNETAYMIADTVYSWLTAEQLQEYKDAALSQDAARIQKIEESKAYRKLWEQMNGLRISMKLNDIFIVYYTAEEMRAYDGDKENWQPLHYLLDCYPDETFRLGSSSSMNPDNRELFAEVPQTGKKQKKYIISNGEFGENTSALLPVLDAAGNTVAVIGVELPMVSMREKVTNFMVTTLSMTLLAMAIIMVIFVFYLYRSVIVPVKLIAKEAEVFGERGDKVSEKLQEMKKSGDEIQMLSESIVNMEKGIIDYVANIEKITAEKERIGAELNVATQIQADMLPRIFPAFPGREEFDIYASMTPAKEVGGDFYDMFMVDEDHLALVIADVSGKGVPAALFMVIAKTLLKNRTQAGGDPAEIFGDVNNQLCEGNEAMLFVTAWLAVITISTGEGVAANAGHEHPLLRRKDGRYELVKYDHDFVLAGMEGMEFRSHTFQLEPGDSLFVYTDGVAEANNPDEELFGEERIVETLNQLPDAEPKETVENMLKNIYQFSAGAEQFDDITMLCLKYFGPAGSSEKKDAE